MKNSELLVLFVILSVNTRTGEMKLRQTPYAKSTGAILDVEIVELYSRLDFGYLFESWNSASWRELSPFRSSIPLNGKTST